jgi:DNA-binding transcriptional ArsR family regulator
MAFEEADHPLRQRILAMVGDEPVDSVQISRRLNQSLSQASFHLRVLADRGAIAAVQEESAKNRYVLSLEPGRTG